MKYIFSLPYKWLGHRALQDAKNLARVFMKTKLSVLLMRPLPVRSLDEQHEYWRVRLVQKDLQEHYNITRCQGQRLAQQGFTRETLKELSIECQYDVDEFKRILHKRGIYSEPLRQRLAAMQVKA